jgi:hypothetical protein
MFTLVVYGLLLTCLALALFHKHLLLALLIFLMALLLSVMALLLLVTLGLILMTVHLRGMTVLLGVLSVAVVGLLAQAVIPYSKRIA